MTTPERTASTEAELVQWFGDHMLAKLRENAHKGHWSTVDAQQLLEMLRAEVVELGEAFAGESIEAIVRECADVANFAAMIADVEKGSVRHGAAFGAYPGGTAGMYADLQRAANERDRWADRIKELEERLRIVSAVANGRPTT